MENIERLKKVLRDALNLGARADALTESSRLLGDLPELDSMAVVTVLASIESEYGIQIAGDELSADLFSTLGTLNQFLLEKLGHGRSAAA